MKSLIKLTILVMLPLISFAGNISKVAKSSESLRTQGTNSGGGGDHDGQAFTAVGRLVKEQIAGQKNFIKIDSDELENALQTVEVEFVDEQLYLNGVKKDALNYSATKKIQVYKKVWEKMSLNAKKALALHEYLGILGIKDTTYNISYKLLNLKPEKFQCSIIFGSKVKHDRAQLSTKIDPTYDGGLKYDANALTLERQRLVLGDEILVATWDLERENKENPWNGVRFTKIYMESSEFPGALQFGLDFGSKDGKYKSTERDAVSLSFLFTQKNVLGQIKRLGEANSKSEFPGSSELGLTIAELGLFAVADCRVR